MNVVIGVEVNWGILSNCLALTSPEKVRFGHEAEKYQFILKKMDILSDDIREYRPFVPKGHGGQFTVAVGIGASDGYRMWNTESWVQCISYFGPGINWRFLGSESDHTFVCQIASELPDCKLVNECGIHQLADIPEQLSLCHCYVGMDSGLGHLAGLVGIPVVTISGFPVWANGQIWHANNIARFRPRGEHCVVCAPCRALFRGLR